VNEELTDGRKVFLTGISGFLGSHTALALLEKGYRVAGLRRSTPLPALLKDSGVETVNGDLNRPEGYADVLRGCGAVIHAAAMSSFSERDERAYRTVNVEGTRTLLNAAETAGIGTFVYVGSRGTRGVAPRPEDSDETLPAADARELDAYIRSKAGGEDLVTAAAGRGVMRCVIVSPTALVGTGDEKPTPIGRIILAAMHGRIKTFLEGGINVIDVEDAARGVAAALEKGANGDRYLLGNTNVTLRELFGTIADIVGQPRIFVKVPYCAAYPAAAVLTAALRSLGMASPVTPRKVYTLNHCHSYCSCRKAVAELGMPRTPLRETLEKTVRWFAGGGVCR